jgi:Polyketide cyclase / dehydrase and lipid transport
MRHAPPRRSHAAVKSPAVFERRVWIRAAPSVVWTSLHDPRAARTIQRELRLGPAIGAWPGAGSFRPATLQLGLLREPASIESLEARPEARFRYRLVSDDLSSEWTWTFESLAGGTRVVHVAAVEPSSPVVASRWTQWLARLGRDRLGGVVEAHLRGLKHVAEAAAPDARGRGRPGGF